MQDPRPGSQATRRRWYQRWWVWALVLLVFLANPDVGWFDLSMFVSQVDCSQDFHDQMDPAPPYAELPLETKTTVSLTLPRGDNALSEGFNDAFAGVSFPRGDISGSIELKAGPPICFLPMIKFATVPYSATARLTWQRGSEYIHVVAGISGTLSISACGLLGLTRFRREAGRSIGNNVRQHLSDLLAR